ncbi:MAG: YcaO-related McrA-glycine thioamidation protein [Methanomicrobiales archaeon]|nr:YcaO-related McrA-glycine thioamidation protein [Methanomicrobiales archaeon]
MGYTIRRVEKRFFRGTHRARPPEDVHGAIAPLMPAIGVAEVVDITETERLDIPVFAAVRPRTAVGATRFFSGKGIEPRQAEVAAGMEAIERYSAEYHGDRMELASYEEIGLTRALDPRDLMLSRPLGVGEKIHWSPGWDILNDEAVMVPSNAVFHPYISLGETERLFRSDTTGLAAGCAMEEAILHALMEVVEWDALSVAERKKSLGRRLRIDGGGDARNLLDRFQAAGIEIHLWLVEGRTALPTVAAAADDTQTRDPAMLVMGVGTHTSPEIAAVNALLEVAETRSLMLHGMVKEEYRIEMARRAGYERLKRINKVWFAPAEEVRIEDVEDVSTPWFDEDIDAALRQVGEHADRVCMVDLTRTAVPVVRIVVPGFELSHADQERGGRSV